MKHRLRAVALIASCSGGLAWTQEAREEPLRAQRPRDASLVRAATLIVRSERDFWSRPEDRATLEKDLVWAPRVTLVVLPGATHFAHLDRLERGRDRLIRELVEFLGEQRLLPVTG